MFATLPPAICAAGFVFAVLSVNASIERVEIELSKSGADLLSIQVPGGTASLSVTQIERIRAYQLIENCTAIRIWSGVRTLKSRVSNQYSTQGFGAVVFEVDEMFDRVLLNGNAPGGRVNSGVDPQVFSLPVARLGVLGVEQLGVDLASPVFLSIFDRTFEVVGDYRANEALPSLDRAVVVPYGTMPKAGPPVQLLCRTNSSAASTVIEYLPSVVGLGRPANIGVSGLIQVNELRSRLRGSNDSLATEVAIGLLLLCVLVNVIVQLRSISSRHVEIGLQRAMGATKGLICLSFLLEGFVYAIGQSALTVLLVALAAISHLVVGHSSTTWELTGLAIGLSAILSVLVNASAAVHASRIDPVRALALG